MPDSEMASLRRAMEVGFAKLEGRFDVVEERLVGLKKIQDRHEEELKETQSRRWPLPVLLALGSAGGLATAAWSMAPHH